MCGRFTRSSNFTEHANQATFLGQLGLWKPISIPPSYNVAPTQIGLPELHIYDQETSPETELRQRAAALVNQRQRCRAFVTQKRSLENYLHPNCIREISGLALAYGDDDDVAELVARACHERQGKNPEWDLLPGRARKRFLERAKKWLNGRAVELMTPELPDEQDPCGEVRGWLMAAGEMLGGEPGGNHAC